LSQSTSIGTSEASCKISNKK